MNNVLAPMFAVGVYIAGRIGPDEPVTGWVFLNALVIAALTYVFCIGVDKLAATLKAKWQL